MKAVRRESLIDPTHVARILRTPEDIDKLPAHALLPPSPIELAKLAASLNPGLAQTEPIRAIKEAVEFYVATLDVWHEISAHQNASNAIDSLDGTLGHFLWYDAAQEADERTWFKLGVKGDDRLLNFLGVKTERAARSNILDYLRTHPSPRHSAATAEKRLDKYARRTDEGKTFHLLPHYVVEDVKKWKTERKKIGGKKARDTIEKKAKQGLKG
jgi:hypothetical protein